MNNKQKTKNTNTNEDMMKFEMFKEELSRKLYEIHHLRHNLYQLLDEANFKILDQVNYEQEYIHLLKSCREQLMPLLATEGLLLAARTIEDNDYLESWYYEANYSEPILKDIIGDSSNLDINSFYKKHKGENINE